MLKLLQAFVMNDTRFRFVDWGLPKIQMQCTQMHVQYTQHNEQNQDRVLIMGCLI
jgi:hypothetical protein